MGIIFIGGVPALYQLGLLSTPEKDFTKWLAFMAVNAFFGMTFALALRKWFILKQKLVSLSFLMALVCLTQGDESDIRLFSGLPYPYGHRSHSAHPSLWQEGLGARQEEDQGSRWRLLLRFLLEGHLQLRSRHPLGLALRLLARSLGLPRRPRYGQLVVVRRAHPSLPRRWHAHWSQRVRSDLPLTNETESNS